MGNAAYAVYEYNGQILHNIEGVSISRAGGGESTPIRTITPARAPIGWRHGQKPDYTITFNVALLDEAVEVDWKALEDSKEEFTFNERIDAFFRIFEKCVVQSVESSTDENNAVTWAVTVQCLESKYVA